MPEQNSGQDKRMAEALSSLQESGALRHLASYPELIDFSSNDYLGLARDQDFIAAYQQKLASLNQMGSTGSRLLSGEHNLIDKFEQKAARFHKAESALLFPSGHSANSACISTFARRGDYIFYDEKVHASMHEGMRISKAKRFAFRHLDLDHLQELIAAQNIDKKAQVFILSEATYSMDGDLCPLKDLVRLCKQFGWNLILDEAHSGGVYDQGRGLATLLELQDDIFCRILTYGKAFGLSGAVVLGSSLMREYLINYCRPFIFSTAAGLYHIAALDLAYDWIASEKADQARTRLLRLSEICLRFLSQFDFAVRYQADFSALGGKNNLRLIWPIEVPGNDRVLQMAELLRSEGFDLRPIRYPSVAQGSERLRLVIHAHNEEEDLIRLWEILKIQLA
jgi:8-amino-7-oxononanoate synthase